MRLYRPVGAKELRLIEASGYTAFPPRLPEQPIFYPVLHIAYARQIASEWNVTDANSEYQGYVLSFDVDDAYAARYETHTVGARGHQELWVPAEELDTFNRHIIGKIEVLETYEGDGP